MLSSEVYKLFRNFYSNAKRGHSVNRDTSETVEKSLEINHVVGKTKSCPELEIEAWFVGSSLVKIAFLAARHRPGGVSSESSEVRDKYVVSRKRGYNLDRIK
uniref:Uncharacterized protein n=1 Tax=Magallana gigas TaxID=29159 RepID=A0A8W8MDS8_MAGGI